MTNCVLKEIICSCLSVHRKRLVAFFGKEELLACKSLGNWINDMKQVLAFFYFGYGTVRFYFIYAFSSYKMKQQEISSLDESDQDFSNFVFPIEYTPRNDLIWNLILTDQRIINIVTNKSLINLSENSYVSTPKKLSNNGAYNILYIPHGTQNSLPPILINISEKLDNLNLSQIIQHCTDISE